MELQLISMGGWKITLKTNFFFCIHVKTELFCSIFLYMCIDTPEF